MPDTLMRLPEGLPVPVDDGAASHLNNAVLPSLALHSTLGKPVNLARLAKTVIFFYPRTGIPGRPVGASWDKIPGARGCTPQSCGFRDLHARFKKLGVKVYGCSTQTTAYQRAFKKRNNVAFDFLSDYHLELVRTMRLPTFEYPVESGGPDTLIRRMAWYIDSGRIAKVWYPVFPPDKNAETVLSWLEGKDA